METLWKPQAKTHTSGTLQKKFAFWISATYVLWTPLTFGVHNMSNTTDERTTATDINGKVQAPFRMKRHQLDRCRRLATSLGLSVSELVEAFVEHGLTKGKCLGENSTITLQVPSALAAWMQQHWGFNVNSAPGLSQDPTSGKLAFLSEEPPQMQVPTQLPSARALPSVGTPIVIDTSLPDAFGFRNSGV